ncbi:hypothetical protein [Luteipulveratus mongoliensis]|uniref:Polymerase n=1 Tax=Luteipulveratus mongoliensis TaxID=571913 RepID=A0A0K1JHC8_9MICO|nr:hypothetical protein [Luteipulveratus mongoliensis]AKU16106.1 hypothetical protein VV02_09930 [Luteipulveratus mongoliensis]
MTATQARPARPGGARRTGASRKRPEGPRLNTVNIFATVLYAVLLVLVIDYFIADHFRYIGYTSRPWRWRDVAVWLVMLAVLGSMNFRRWIHPSHAAFTFLLATVGIPILSIPVFWGPLSPWGVFVLQVTTLATFGIIRLCLMGGRTPTRGVELPESLFWVLVFGFVTAGLGYLILSLGISPGMLSLNDVYEQRSEYTSNVSSIGAYLVGWVGAGVLPVVLGAGMYRRNRPLTVAAAMGILVLYSITGYKSYLVGVALTMGAYFLCSPKRRQGYQWLLALGGTVVAAGVIDYITHGFAFSSLLVRRALSTAGLNTALYFDYFSEHPRYGLRHSVLSFMGAPPYELTPSHLIGYQYYRSSSVAANANLVADGYANFGIAGCLGMAVVLGLYLRWFDKWSAHLPLQVSAPAMTLVLVAAANTAALTVLSTHGGIVLALMMLGMPVAVRSTTWGAPKTPRKQTPRRRTGTSLSRPRR